MEKGLRTVAWIGRYNGCPRSLAFGDLGKQKAFRTVAERAQRVEGSATCNSPRKGGKPQPYPSVRSTARFWGRCFPRQCRNRRRKHRRPSRRSLPPKQKLRSRPTHTPLARTHPTARMQPRLPCAGAFGQRTIAHIFAAANNCVRLSQRPQLRPQRKGPIKPLCKPPLAPLLRPQPTSFRLAPSRR
jgi:hypothetical protein